jgi:hypothetical protein
MFDGLKEEITGECRFKERDMCIGCTATNDYHRCGILKDTIHVLSMNQKWI